MTTWCTSSSGPHPGSCTSSRRSARGGGRRRRGSPPSRVDTRGTPRVGGRGRRPVGAGVRHRATAAGRARRGGQPGDPRFAGCGALGGLRAAWIRATEPLVAELAEVMMRTEVGASALDQLLAARLLTIEARSGSSGWRGCGSASGTPPPCCRRFHTLTRQQRLHLHRLRPHWHPMRRILRIGLPAGVQNLITWLAQFPLDRDPDQPPRHDQRRRLGAHRDDPPGEHQLPRRTRRRDRRRHARRPEPRWRAPYCATRSAYLAYGLACCWMGRLRSGLSCAMGDGRAADLSDAAVPADLSARCTSSPVKFIQFGFAASFSSTAPSARGFKERFQNQLAVLWKIRSVI